MDRWEKEGNDLLCFLPDYGEWALITVIAVSHEQWKIKTVKVPRKIKTGLTMK